MALTCCACASPEQVSSRRLQPPVLPTLHHQGHAARGGPGGGLRFAQVSLRCHRDHSKYTGLSSLHAGYLSTSYMVSNQYCITRALPKLKTYDGDVSIVQVCTYDLVGSKNGWNLTLPKVSFEAVRVMKDMICSSCFTLAHFFPHPFFTIFSSAFFILWS